MRLLKGRKVASEILSGIKARIKKDKSKPVLAVVLIGENKASKLYIKLKARAAKKVGIGFYLFKFKSSAKEKEIIKLIKKINKDKKINGIIVQLPLPTGFNTSKIINSISIKKDVDGFHPKNIKKFIEGKGEIYPVFPLAIIRLIESAGVNLKGRSAVIIANSEVFGKIMSSALARKKNHPVKSSLAQGARKSGLFDRVKVEYILADKLNSNLPRLRNADMVITALGKPKLIKGTMLKKGAIIIDGGIKKKGKRTLGDVDFNSVVKTAGYLSPVPGGVGPVTVACLLENVCKLAQQKKK